MNTVDWRRWRSGQDAVSGATRPLPLSAVTLFPTGLGPGQRANPGTIFSLVPFVNNVEQSEQGFALYRGQHFAGLATHEEDARAGWMFSGGSMRFGYEPLSQMQCSDVSVDIFRTRAGHMMLEDWCAMVVLEPMPFLASVVLRAAAPAPMKFGLTLFYYDERCTRAYDPAIDVRVPFPNEAILPQKPPFVSRIRRPKSFPTTGLRP